MLAPLTLTLSLQGEGRGSEAAHGYCGGDGSL